MQGYQAYDSACLSTSSVGTNCATNFLWFAVTSFSAGAGFSSNVDGILGMSSGQDTDHGPLLVEFLYD